MDGLTPSLIENRSNPSAIRSPLHDGGRPTFTTRLLMEVAGVDYNLALRCPPNEWRGMALVGAGLLWGAAFTAFCIWIALGELFARDLTPEGRALITVLATAVRFVMDRKFVAADWHAQGLVYAWSHSLIDKPSPLRRFSRSVSVGGRLLYSLAFSSLIAMVLMTIVFRDASHRQLVQENIGSNAPVIASTIAQYERRLREISDQAARTEQSIAALELERTALLLPAAPDTSRAQQIDKLTADIEEWRTARQEAERAASQHESDRNAEKTGVRVRSSNSGVEGPGRKHDFHRDEALRLRGDAAARATNIESASRQLDILRRDASEEARHAESIGVNRLTTIDARISKLALQRRELLAERAAMQDDRELWIGRRLRAQLAYKPLPDDISDRMRILRTLTAASGLIFALMVALKITIVAFESAGPISKVFFMPPTHYAMWVALRLEDATDFEKDRRAELALTLRCRALQRERAETAERHAIANITIDNSTAVPRQNAVVEPVR